VQCIGEAFGVDAADEAQRKRLSVKPATLETIFDVYMKTREKMQSGQVRIRLLIISLIATYGPQKPHNVGFFLSCATASETRFCISWR
jgi:hypothetical protein